MAFLLMCRRLTVFHHHAVLGLAQGAQGELPPPLEGVVVAEVQHLRVERWRCGRDDSQVDPGQGRPKRVSGVWRILKNIDLKGTDVTLNRRGG